MEPGVVAAAYAIETAIEGTIGAAIAIAKPTLPLRAKFQKLATSIPLRRSSHSLSFVRGKAYIFGGEIQPRQPVDNDMHIFTMPVLGPSEADYECVKAQAEMEKEEAPAPRIGHTAAVISDRIYIFGGRGGKEMKPLEEQGRVWEFNTSSRKWKCLEPVQGSLYPAARSYHSSTSTEHPLAVSVPAGPTESSAYGTVFVHAGCPASGRETDVWAFDVAARTWTPFPNAPEPARGGPCFLFAQNRLYRYGGFDGKVELGGQIDYLDIAVSTIDDQSGKGELMVYPRTGKWETISFPQNASAPGNRSVAGMQPISTGQGRNYLLLFMGERDPSSVGHEGAGKFWDDVWAYQLQSEGKTAASIKDATRQLFGSDTGESSWAQVEIAKSTMSDGLQPRPSERGWFASTQYQDLDSCSVLLWGGVNTKNEREGDGWILQVES
ncbi:MAG: hypothetical protein MMC33_005685 [Icmadophila ericetorum]|nr:hypothetical protein [Icmadophila ericetorum]